MYKTLPNQRLTENMTENLCSKSEICCFHMVTEKLSRAQRCKSLPISIVTHRREVLYTVSGEDEARRQS